MQTNLDPIQVAKEAYRQAASSFAPMAPATQDKMYRVICYLRSVTNDGFRDWAESRLGNQLQLSCQVCGKPSGVLSICDRHI